MGKLFEAILNAIGDKIGKFIGTILILLFLYLITK